MDIFVAPSSESCYNKDMSLQMSRIRSPVVLAWGRQDFIYPEKMAKVFASHIKNASIVEVEGDHGWLVFKPSEILKCLDA